MLLEDIFTRAQHSEDDDALSLQGRFPGSRSKVPASEPPPKRLERSASDPLDLRVKKGLIRRFESAQDLLRTMRHGSDYKASYHNRAVDKKRVQVEAQKYSAFDRMDDISTKIDIGEIKDPNLLAGQNMYLGMLPDDILIDGIRLDIARANGKQEVSHLNIMSIIEDFELERLLKDIKIEFKEFGEIVNATIKSFKKGRYTLTLHQGESLAEGNLKNLGIRSWKQYSTPDRTMMTTGILEEAISDAVTLMKKQEPVYIHCKSGKGRSATVVVGSRVAMLMDIAKGNSKKLSRQDIDTMIEEQIMQVKAARSEIGVSEAQKTNLKKVLYRRAGL